MTAEQKAFIDNATLVELLRIWRFSPVGTEILQGEAGAYFSNRMFRMRDENNSAWVAASKAVGW